MTPSLEQGTWDLRSSAGYKDALPQASGGAPLNACLQRGQRESWAIKDRVGCGGHMRNPQPSWAEQWLSYKQRVWCLEPDAFRSVQSRSVPLPAISAAMTAGEWGSLFLGVTFWNTQIPSQGAEHIFKPGDISEVPSTCPRCLPDRATHCCTHPSGHSATSALWNWPPRFGRALAHWSLRRETGMISLEAHQNTSQANPGKGAVLIFSVPLKAVLIKVPCHSALLLAQEWDLVQLSRISRTCCTLQPLC